MTGALIARYVLIAIVGYLLGNFQTGVKVSFRFARFDIRTRGSKSAGTTNVLRTLGWKASALTLLGDVLKGLLAALFGLWLCGLDGARLGGLFAILGHNWPALHNFQGGKGIATSLGVILVLSPLIGLMLFLCQVLVVALTRTMSLASLCSAALYFLLTLVFSRADLNQTVFAGIVTALAFFSHRENISRLIAGNENKLDFHKIDSITRDKK